MTRSRTDDSQQVHEQYNCHCDELFAGVHCHKRRTHMIALTTESNRFTPAMPDIGGYFSFRSGGAGTGQGEE
jgi:hypothetical protein